MTSDVATIKWKISSEDSDLREQSSPKRIQYFLEKSFRLDRRLVIQSVAIKLINRRNGDDNAFGETMLQNIQSQHQGRAEGRGHAVVGWVIEGKKVDTRRRLCRYHVAAFRASHWNGEEGWDWRHIVY